MVLASTVGLVAGGALSPSPWCSALGNERLPELVTWGQANLVCPSFFVIASTRSAFVIAWRR